MGNGPEFIQPNQLMSLADLVRAEEQGLDINRLLFARYLVLTKRLTEYIPGEDEQVESVSTIDHTSSIAPAGVVFDSKPTETLQPAVLEPKDYNPTSNIDRAARERIKQELMDLYMIGGLDCFLKNGILPTTTIEQLIIARWKREQGKISDGPKAA